MAQDAEVKRQAVMAAYSGEEWRKKVQKMDESQVIAIYVRLKAQGKLKL